MVITFKMNKENFKLSSLFKIYILAGLLKNVHGYGGNVVEKKRRKKRIGFIRCL